jgi:hypothetical protein
MTIQVLSFLALLLLLAAPAQAVTTYSYVGGHFDDQSLTPWSPGTAGVYTTADGISGSFTIAEGFQPGFGLGGRVAVFLGPGIAGSGIQERADGVVDYSFTDGHQTLTRANSTASIGLLLPWGVAEGSFPSWPWPSDFHPYADTSLPWPSDFHTSWWEVFIETPTGGHIHTGFGGGARGDLGRLDANNFGWNVYGGVGTWTVTVPEPMSLVLAVAGIGGLIGARRFYRN